MDNLKAEKIRLLQEAKKLIDFGEEQFICFALVRVAAWSPASRMSKVASQELCKQIAISLPPGVCSLSQLLDHVYLHYESINRPLKHWGFYAQCRMAWIDKMIYDLENEK